MCKYAILCWLFFLFLAPPAQAQVEFDVPKHFIARTFKRSEDSQFLQSTIPYTARLKGNSISTTTRIEVDIDSTNSDFTQKAIKISKLPKQVLIHKFVGTIRSERVDALPEISGKIGAGLAMPDAELGVFVGGSVKPQGKTTTSTESPSPLVLILTSGTTNRETGFYISMRRSDRIPFEGMHLCNIEFETPIYWRGDCLIVRFVAYDEKNQKLSSATFPIGIVLEGEESSRNSAIVLADAVDRISVLSKKASISPSERFEAVNRLRLSRLDMESHSR